MNILHLSDLHFGTTTEASTWSSQLAEDLKREFGWQQIDALILSGDVANLSVPDEYTAARNFIDRLKREFHFGAARIVIVPGNHDLNWGVSKAAYKSVQRGKYKGPKDENHVIEKGRRLWAKRPAQYTKRFEHFRRFYNDVKGSEYPEQYERQFSLDLFIEANLLVLGLNSAWQLDHHYTQRANIHPVALSNALDLVRENTAYEKAIKIAVWHHPVQSDSDDRIHDSGFLEQLAKAGFSLALHGHIHKAENNLFRYDQGPQGRHLEIIAAGTFGAPTEELSRGYPWQYNLLTLRGNRLRVDTRRREGENGAWKPDARWIVRRGGAPQANYEIKLPTSTTVRVNARANRVDWSKSPEVLTFHGRKRDLSRLERWVVKDKCRLIGIWGMGGIGKTFFAKKLASNLRPRFDYVIWRSLFNAPPIDTLVDDLLKFLSNQQLGVLPGDLDSKLVQLIDLLSKNRCLLILDNFDAIFRSGTSAARYREGFEPYGKLLRLIAEMQHKSCVLLTSREAPKEFTLAENLRGTTRSQTLQGLTTKDVRALLKHKGLTGTGRDWENFVERFSGNPEFIRMVSGDVVRPFRGDLGAFLRKGQPAAGSTREYFIKSLFMRLTPIEQEIMYWLAIEREPITWERLREDIVRPIEEKVFVEALESLCDRFLVEMIAGTFSLPNVIVEYLTDLFCEKVVDDICKRRNGLFGRHALIISQTKDYIRESQTRLILKPIADRLVKRLRGSEGLKLQLLEILENERGKPMEGSGYSVGNILNLFFQLKVDLTGYNFSNTTIRQAHFQDIVLHDVDFTMSVLWHCTFLETLSGVLSIAAGDGELLASGDASGEVRVWNSSDGRIISIVRAHSDWVRQVIFGSHSRLLYSSSDDRTVKAWDWSTGECLRVFSGHQGRVRALALSSDGRVLVSGCDDCKIRWWNAKTGTCFRVSHGHSDHVRAVLFSPDGSTLASCAEDFTIKIWSVITGECLQTFEGHARGVCAIAFSEDGLHLASGSEDDTARIWHVETGRCVQTFRGHTRWIWSVALSPNGRVLATGSGDHTIRLWDATTGDCLKTLSGHTNWLRSVVFSDDGRYLFSGGDDRTIRIWDAKTAECLRTLHGYTGWIYCVTFSADGKMLAFGSEDRTIKLWSIDQSSHRLPLVGHTDWIWSVAFTRNNKLLASASGDQTIRLWDVASNSWLMTLRGHRGQVRSVAFSPDGLTLASGSDDRTIKLWDTKTGRCVNTLLGHVSQVWSLMFSPDGKFLASGSDDRVINLWELANGKRTKSFRGHERRVLSIAFSSDGRRIASGGEDQTIRVWDILSGNLVFNLTGHHSSVQSVAFSHDDSLVISGAALTARVWDAVTGQCWKVATVPTDRVRSVLPLDNGRLLTCGNQRGTLTVWEITSEEAIGQLRATRPYEGLIITDVAGLTEVEKNNLKELGAVEV